MPGLMGKTVLVSGSCTAAAVAVVWHVYSTLSPPVTAPLVYDKWWGAEWANREVMPVGSLVGQVTAGLEPNIHGSVLLAMGVMDRYTDLLHLHKQHKHLNAQCLLCSIYKSHLAVQFTQIKRN